MVEMEVNKRKEELSKIAKMVEADVAPLCYNFYRTNKLRNERMNLQNLKFFVKNLVLEQNLVEKAVKFNQLVKSGLAKNAKNAGLSFNNEFEIALMEWIAQIYDVNCDDEISKDQILNDFLESFESSNLLNICKIMEDGKWNGYLDFSLKMNEKEV